jgi:hypothetical protein
MAWARAIKTKKNKEKRDCPQNVASANIPLLAEREVVSESGTWEFPQPMPRLGYIMLTSAETDEPSQTAERYCAHRETGLRLQAHTIRPVRQGRPGPQPLQPAEGDSTTVESPNAQPVPGTHLELDPFSPHLPL